MQRQSSVPTDLSPLSMDPKRKHPPCPLTTVEAVDAPQIFRRRVDRRCSRTDRSLSSLLQKIQEPQSNSSFASMKGSSGRDQGSVNDLSSLFQVKKSPEVNSKLCGASKHNTSGKEISSLLSKTCTRASSCASKATTHKEKPADTLFLVQLVQDMQKELAKMTKEIVALRQEVTQLRLDGRSGGGVNTGDSEIDPGEQDCTGRDSLCNFDFA